MQVKTASVATTSTSVGLNINSGRDKVLKHNTENINTMTFDGETVECVESFT